MSGQPQRPAAPREARTTATSRHHVQGGHPAPTRRNHDQRTQRATALAWPRPTPAPAAEDAPAAEPAPAAKPAKGKAPRPAPAAKAAKAAKGKAAKDKAAKAAKGKAVKGKAGGKAARFACMSKKLDDALQRLKAEGHYHFAVCQATLAAVEARVARLEAQPATQQAEPPAAAARRPSQRTPVKF